MQTEIKKSHKKNCRTLKSPSSTAISMGQLIKEVHQLKQELSSIKSKKSLRTLPALQPDESTSNIDITQSYQPADTMHNKTLSKFTVDHESELLESFALLEDTYMESTARKLHKAIRNHETRASYKYLNRLLSCVSGNRCGGSLDGTVTELNFRSQDNCQSQLHEQNAQLSHEVGELKQLLAYQIELTNCKERQLQQMEEQCRDVLNKYQELNSHVSTSQRIHAQLRAQKQQESEKCRIYERKLQKKEEELLLIHEDLNYIQVQCEKHRTYKKQLEQINAEAEAGFTRLKQQQEEQIETLLKDRNKWKLQCESRRVDEQELLGLQSQLNLAKKECEEHRRQALEQTSQHNQLRRQLHQVQKKCMQVEGEKYRLQAENQKLLTSFQYYKNQMGYLQQEVEGLQTAKAIGREKNEQIAKSEKVKALEEIHSMIRIQRNQLN